MSGESQLAPLMQLGDPLLLTIAPTTYIEHQAMFDAGAPHGILSYWRSDYLQDLSDGVIQALCHGAWSSPSATSYTIIFQLGGAVAEPEPESAAFEDRTVGYAMNVTAICSEAEATGQNVEWTRSYWSTLHPFSSGKT